MGAVAEQATKRETLKVLREDGTLLADWAESFCGSGRVRLRIYPRQRPAFLGGPVVGVTMTTLEALELCLAGRMVRDAEAGRMLGEQVPARAASELISTFGADAERWEEHLRSKTLEWLGRSCFCPSSFALAMACCKIFSDEKSHPDTLRAMERCVAYLSAVPAARVRLHAAGRLSDVWARLVDRWDELEACFLAECGAGFERSEVGDRTEAMLREIVQG